MQPFSHTRTVTFADTDAAGIAHFARMLQWVEEAEAAWLHSLGITQFVEEADGGRLGFPKVAVQCDYRRPVRAGQAVGIGITPTRAGGSSLTYAFEMTCGGAVVARGEVTIVHARMRPGGELAKLPLPEALKG